MGNIEKSNQAVFDLVKDIPNVHWVDAQKYLPKNMVEIHGHYLYSDQDHLTEFGSYYMGWNSTNMKACSSIHTAAHCSSLPCRPISFVPSYAAVYRFLFGSVDGSHLPF